MQYSPSGEYTFTTLGILPLEEGWGGKYVDVGHKGWL